ncbi:MAG: hypothetical protein RL030_304 [Pseudomonadota bacterium]|jgi:hypothetical protein
MTSGSETRRRQKGLRVRLTEAERAALDVAAEQAGLSRASYARQVLLAVPPPRQARRPPVERVELARLLAHIGKVGSNLNQLAHLGNAGAAVDGAALAAELAELATVRQAIRAALGRDA